MNMSNYIFELSDKVTRKSVSYKNRFGITIAADLYLAKDFDETQKHPAVVIGPPFGGVKEQGSGIYAQNLAERGFVALAFDPSYNGNSGGFPRHIASPDVFVEDFSAGVDYLGTRPFVDREKIGAIGICGSGGFALSAAQVDTRIKAVATASMYDISRGTRYGLYDSFTKEQRENMMKLVADQRYLDFESDTPALMPRMNLGSFDSMDPISREFAEFYSTPRGYHHNSITQFSFSTGLSFMNFSLLDHLEDISPRPIFLVIGENAHSRYFSEDVFKKAGDPKELYIVPNARHIDLYDKTDLIPFDKLEAFFTENLK